MPIAAASRFANNAIQLQLFSTDVCINNVLSSTAHSSDLAFLPVPKDQSAGLFLSNMIYSSQKREGHHSRSHEYNKLSNGVTAFCCMVFTVSLMDYSYGDDFGLPVER